ncbi:MAG TPA: heavy metal-associated domain-containing protein [Salinimicrobium sp.]|nr:heavy metal-associated domain-containing protein [Salinimicrobium sp.]
MYEKCVIRLKISKLVVRMLFTAFLFILTGTACNSQKEDKQENTQQDSSVQNLTKTVIPIEGMTCNACVATIKKKLSSMEDIKEVEVSLAHRSATVYYEEGKITPQQVQDSINKLGYKAGAPTTQMNRE